MDLISSILKPFDRKTAPGAVPGTFVTKPEEPKPVIQLISYSNGSLTDRTIESLDELVEHKESSEVTWINVIGLGDAKVIHKIGEVFGLHKLALEDVVHVHQRPKIEEYNEHLFLVARMVDLGERLQTKQLSIFVGKNFLITFQEKNPQDCLDPVRKRIRKSVGRIREYGVDYLAYALLDSIIDHYFPVIETYSERLDELDNNLIHDKGDTSIAAIHNFHSDLLLLRRSIRPHRELINGLLRDANNIITDETRLYLRDCYDHTIQIGEAIDTYRDTCTGLREFHLATVSNRTNEVMKTLTIVSTIFIPLSFLAGLYGMNFQYMPELQWRLGYPFALGLMGSVGIGLLLWFRHKGWF